VSQALVAHPCGGQRAPTLNRRTAVRALEPEIPYDLSSSLVIGIASSALFDLAESDEVFRSEGEAAYREYQDKHIDDPFDPGVAFAFTQRLLSLNDLGDAEGPPLVEVIVMSRNDPFTGLRVMRSAQHHDLALSRAVFMQGRSPYKFMPGFNMSLFLSASETDVREATDLGLPAGRVLESSAVNDQDDDLRIAFDFDGVLADDQSERVYQADGMAAFHEHEVSNDVTPHNPGPLRDFLARVNAIQRREEERRRADPDYKIRVHVSIVTARNAPSHERAVRSLMEWGVTVNDAFFLGGIDKGKVLEILRPHIFFDDQMGHLDSASRVVPSVHIPYGVTNSRSLSDEPSTADSARAPAPQ
jgi:5'-nucleotidase